MKFSERNEYSAIRTALQVEDVDEPLKNGLWNVLLVWIFQPDRQHWINRQSLSSRPTRLARQIWLNFYKKRIDKIPQDWDSFLSFVEIKFFNGLWYEIYDLIEFLEQNFGDQKPPLMDVTFAKACNSVLEKERSAWRIIGAQVSRVSSDVEIAAIEQAELLDGRLAPVSIHIRAAVAKMSDRQAPDYRNSIKESISAVEGICKIIGGNTKAELAEALRCIEKKGILLDGAIVSAFKSIYGFTSNSQGIRHALLDQPNLEHFRTGLNLGIPKRTDF